MRKLAIFMAILTPMLFLGCDVVSYSIELSNDTETKTVSYTYNGAVGELGPLETRLYEVGAWTHPPVNAVDQNGIASVYVRTNGMTGDHAFVYVRPIILEVKNTLPVNLTVRAGNFIDNDGSMELIVYTGETETAVIYTENPVFTTAGNFPTAFDVAIISFECECDDDRECENEYDEDSECECDNHLICVRDKYGLEDIWGNAERRPQRKMYVTIR